MADTRNSLILSFLLTVPYCINLLFLIFFNDYLAYLHYILWFLWELSDFRMGKGKIDSSLGLEAKALNLAFSDFEPALHRQSEV